MKNNPEAKKHLPEQMSKSAKIVAIIGAAFGALLLWLYAIGYDSTLFERGFDGVEVVVEGTEALAENKGLTLKYEETFSPISITVRGKRSELNEYSASDFKAVIDVSEAESAGLQKFNIVVKSPNGVEVVDQSSSVYELIVDEFVKRQSLLAVNVDVGNGNAVMTDGVMYFEEKVSPLAVEVEGPKSMLDEIEGAYVKFILDDKIITDNINGWGPIELRDKNGNVINNPYIKLLEDTAYVEIQVTKKKTVPVEVVFNGDSEINPVSSAVPSVQSITVIGSPSDLDNFNKYIIEIDESTLSGSADLDFSVALPDGIKRDESTPSEISVRVDLREGYVARKFSFFRKDIAVNGLPEGSVANVRDGVVITLVGIEDVISLIDSEDITVYVDYDLEKLILNRDGSFTSEISVDLGSDYPGVYSVGDISVTFEIK